MLFTAGLMGWAIAVSLGRDAALSDDRILALAEAAYREAVQSPPRSLAGRRLFSRSAEQLETLGKRGIENTALSIDLAQAYLLADDIPHAILACRRGLRLESGNPVLQSLLEEARNQVDYPAYGPFAKPPTDHWPPMLPRLDPWLQLGIALLVYGLACIFFTRWRMVRRGVWLSLAVVSLICAALPGFGLLVDENHRSWERTHPLVIVASDANVVLHKGNGARYPCYNATAQRWEEAADSIPPAATTLKPGVEANLRFDKGEWLQIELASGEVGWVKRSDVLVASGE